MDFARSINDFVLMAYQFLASVVTKKKKNNYKFCANINKIHFMGFFITTLRSIYLEVDMNIKQ